MCEECHLKGVTDRYRTLKRRDKGPVVCLLEQSDYVRRFSQHTALRYQAKTIIRDIRHTTRSTL